MPCTLSAYGPDFDVDRFVKQSALAVDDVWHKGEPILPRSHPHGSPKKTSGVTYEIGDQDEFERLQPQIEAAVEFLRANEAELRRLSDDVGVKWYVLTMGVRWRNDVLNYVETIPPTLCLLAGRIGCSITISHYWMEDGLPRLIRPADTPDEETESDAAEDES